jgi:hypothetical protein
VALRTPFGETVVEDCVGSGINWTARIPSACWSATRYGSCDALLTARAVRLPALPAAQAIAGKEWLRSRIIEDGYGRYRIVGDNDTLTRLHVAAATGHAGLLRTALREQANDGSFLAAAMSVEATIFAASMSEISNESRQDALEWLARTYPADGWPVLRQQRAYVALLNQTSPPLIEPLVTVRVADKVRFVTLENASCWSVEHPQSYVVTGARPSQTTDITPLTETVERTERTVDEMEKTEMRKNEIKITEIRNTGIDPEGPQIARESSNSENRLSTWFIDRLSKSAWTVCNDGPSFASGAALHPRVHVDTQYEVVARRSVTDPESIQWILPIHLPETLRCTWSTNGSTIHTEGTANGVAMSVAHVPSPRFIVSAYCELNHSGAHAPDRELTQEGGMYYSANEIIPQGDHAPLIVHTQIVVQSAAPTTPRARLLYERDGSVRAWEGEVISIPRAGRVLQILIIGGHNATQVDPSQAADHNPIIWNVTAASNVSPKAFLEQNEDGARISIGALTRQESQIVLHSRTEMTDHDAVLLLHYVESMEVPLRWEQLEDVSTGMLTSRVTIAGFLFFILLAILGAALVRRNQKSVSRQFPREPSDPQSAEAQGKQVRATGSQLARQARSPNATLPASDVMPRMTTAFSDIHRKLLQKKVGKEHTTLHAQRLLTIDIATMLVMGQPEEKIISDLVAKGFERDDIVRALRNSQTNGKKEQ